MPSRGNIQFSHPNMNGVNSFKLCHLRKFVVDECMQTKKSKNHEYLVSFAICAKCAKCAIIAINLICNWLAYISKQVENLSCCMPQQKQRLVF